MLEEGQRKDWFGSEFIRTCAILAAIFVPDVRALGSFWRRSPSSSCALSPAATSGFPPLVAFVLGLGLYGTVYLIPLYLDQVQGYSPLLIGETLIWVGLPQLLDFSGPAVSDEEIGHPAAGVPRVRCCSRRVVS